MVCFSPGSDGMSSRKHMNTENRLCFQAGYEDWFVVTTERSLGELQSITVWHDNVGTSANWWVTSLAYNCITFIY